MPALCIFPEGEYAFWSCKASSDHYHLLESASRLYRPSGDTRQIKFKRSAYFYSLPMVNFREET
jgi:hypothetical protein